MRKGRLVMLGESGGSGSPQASSDTSLAERESHGPMTRWVEASLVLGGMKSPAPHLAFSNTAGGEAVLPHYSLMRWRYRLPLTFAYWKGGRVTVSLYYLLGAEQQLPRRFPSFQALPFLVLLLERLSLGLFCLFPLMFLGCWLL